MTSHLRKNGPFTRLIRGLRAARRKYVVLTMITSPHRPARPVRLSVLNFYVLTVIGLGMGTSVLGMSLTYQGKVTALSKQTRLVHTLQAERDRLDEELKHHETRLVDLTLQLHALRTELEQVHAVREQILEILPESVGDLEISSSNVGTIPLPAGGALSRDELGSWTEEALHVSRTATKQLLESMQKTYQHAQLYRRKRDHTPSIWPTEGWVSSEFGTRVHPITQTRSTHNGIDIAAPVGTTIVATADGIVRLAGANGGYGLTVIIDHDYGIETLYAHASSLLVKAGESVRRGQPIALVGSTGLSTGPHLHYEIRRNSRPINPRQMLP